MKYPTSAIYYLKRFNQHIDDNFPNANNLAFFSRISIFVDCLKSLLFHGATYTDYFAYNYRFLNKKGRNLYITERRRDKINNAFNPDLKEREIFDSKLNFYQRYSDYLGREWLDFENISYDKFVAFIKRNPTFFVKDVRTFRGMGVYKHRFKADLMVDESNESANSLFLKYKNDNDAYYVLEAPIVQKGVISDLHPFSINTIRVVTLYDTNKDIVHIMSTMIRMGNNNNYRDNFHNGGIGAVIDKETGVIVSRGFDMYGNTYIYHPLTNKQIVGTCIPYWEEVKKFSEEAARLTPSVKYIGWDIVVNENGKLLLVEGNSSPDPDFQQLHYKGLWQDYKQLMKSVK